MPGQADQTESRPSSAVPEPSSEAAEGVRLGGVQASEAAASKARTLTTEEKLLLNVEASRRALM